MKNFTTIFALSVFPLLGPTACARSVSTVEQTVLIRRSTRWVLLPIGNYAETANAGERVEGLVEAAARRSGVASIEHYPALKEDDAHLTMSERQRFEESLSWARAQRFDYAITGSVVEWRYKGTIDSEPVVGLTLVILDLTTGSTVFSASGARTGGAGDSASAMAIHVLQDLFEHLGMSK